MAQHRFDTWSSDWENEIGITVDEFYTRVEKIASRGADRWSSGEMMVHNVRDINAAEALFDELRADHEATKQAETDKAAGLTPMPATPATERQVAYIMDLLAARDRGDIDGGGWMYGPTDRAGVERMSKAEASAYIGSLKGEY